MNIVSDTTRFILAKLNMTMKLHPIPLKYDHKKEELNHDNSEMKTVEYTCNKNYTTTIPI